MSDSAQQAPPASTGGAPNIPFTFTIAVAYHVPLVTLFPAVHSLELAPVEGTHTYTSPDLVLGHIHSLNQDLIGRVTCGYTYAGLNQTLTLCAPEFASSSGMALITMPRTLGAPHASVSRASGHGLAVDDAGNTRYWDFTTPLTPGLGALFTASIHAAARSLIQNAIATEQYNVRERKVLVLPAELHVALAGPNIRALYPFPSDSTSHDGARHQQHGEAATHIPHHVDSWLHAGGGIEHFKATQNFANGIGTKDDPYVDGMKWMPLWRHIFPTNSFSGCTSRDYGKPCTKAPFTQMGAHVIFGTTAAIIPDNGSSYIVPLCPAHNHRTWTGAMLPIDNKDAVWLDGFGHEGP